MPPMLLIAGIPKALIRRNREYKLNVTGWDTRIIPSQDKGATLASYWKRVLAAADGHGPEGVHIIGFHHLGDDDRRSFEKNVGDKHRLIWLSNQLLALYGTDEFGDFILSHAQFEEQWREKIRPQRIASALLLPESSFTPVVASKIWYRTRRVTPSRDDLTAITRLLDDFRQRHLVGSRSVWKDGRDLEFQFSGSRHANTPTERRWKFTYFVDENFHYDVKHSRSNTPFIIIDGNGVSRRFTNYTNVDCHGFIRGGK